MSLAVSMKSEIGPSTGPTLETSSDPATMVTSAWTTSEPPCPKYAPAMTYSLPVPPP